MIGVCVSVGWLLGLRLRWLRSGLTKAGGLTETGRLTERAAGDAGIAALTEARRAGLLAWLLAGHAAHRLSRCTEVAAVALHAGETMVFGLIVDELPLVVLLALIVDLDCGSSVFAGDAGDAASDLHASHASRSWRHTGRAAKTGNIGHTGSILAWVGVPGAEGCHLCLLSESTLLKTRLQLAGQHAGAAAGEPTLLAGETTLLTREPALLTWEPSLLTWEPSLLTWEPSLLTWKTTLLPREPTLLARETVWCASAHAG